MNNTRIRTVLIIFISALLVSVLFNIRSFIALFEALTRIDNDVVEGAGRGLKAGLGARLKFSWFNLIIEFVVFSLVAFFNYSWFEKIIELNRFKKIKIPIIVLSNLIVFFILIPAGKLFHSAYFASMEVDWNKEINFDIRNFLIINVSVFLLAIFVANLLKLMRKMKIVGQENIRLVEEKSKAELSALKEQISPHFFFNTLSSLSTIVRNEKKEVGLEFIQEMSKTYRYTLASKQDTVSLKEELEFLQSYIFLLKKRFGEKLMLNLEISDNAYQSKIPPMSLQLLVENAIQHNVITKSTPLTIKVFIENDMICIENNLQEKESTDSFGMGLENLASRYSLISQKDIIINKDNHKFSVKLPLL